MVVASMSLSASLYCFHELFRCRAVHPARCPCAAGDVETFGKFMKPGGLSRQWRYFPFAPRQGAIRHYEISRIACVPPAYE